MQEAPYDSAAQKAGQVVDLDTGLACLTAIAQFHKLAVEPAQLKHEFGQSDQNGNIPFSDQEILLASKAIGLKAKKTRIKTNKLSAAPWRRGGRWAR